MSEMAHQTEGAWSDKAEVPQLTSDPNPPGGTAGTEVVLEGNHIYSVVKCVFKDGNGVPHADKNPVLNSDHQLKCTVPHNSATGHGEVWVVNTDNKRSNSKGFYFKAS